MNLQQKILHHFNRRKVKFLAINFMGLAGLIIATAAIVFSQDQAAMLTQLSHDLTQSPLGTVFLSITSCFS